MSLFRRRKHPKVTHLPHDRAKAMSALAASDAPKEPKTTLSQRLTIGAVILACLAGVAAISHFVLSGKSLRLDESQSLWQASHTIPGLLRAVATDVHVPLYHLILHFWMLYFGEGVTTVRLLSLIFFLASIPAVYLLARQLLSWRWALFATILFSFSPFMNWYANETRMYTLLALMTALNQYYFFRIIKGRTGWIGFAVTALIGAYSHYFFMFNLATIGLFYLLNRKKFARGTFLKLSSIAVLVAAELSPWLWYFIKLGSASNTRPLLVRPSTVDFFNAFSQFFYGFQDNHINTILISCWPLLVLIAFFAVNQKQRVSTEVSYIITLGFVPVVLAFGLSFVVTPFFLSRYLIAAVAPLTILTVWLISHYKRSLARVGIAVVLIATLLTSYQQDTSASTPVVENYQTAAQEISRAAGPQDVVVISSPFTIYPFEYYYHGVAQIKTLPLWDRRSSGSIPAFSNAALPGQVKQIGSDHQDIYLLLSYNQGYEENIRQYMDTHYQRMSSQHFSDDMNLYVYRVGYVNVPAIGTSAAAAAVQP